MTRSLDFFFFIGSTYTCLAVQRAEAVAARQGVVLRWRPFSVRSIMVEQNNKFFVGKPGKLAYMWRDIERRAAITSGRNTSSARGRLGSRLRNPFSSRTLSWWATLEELVSPTASPISRMLGG